MLKPECLDPKEVLAHLNSLGFNDITPQQLKEFIHDLKKLIKHEQKRSFRQSKSSACDDSSVDYGHTSERSSTREAYDDSDCSSCTYKRHEDFKRGASNKGGVRHRLDYERVQSSFIRPWQLPVYSSLSSRSKKNLDPVTLYHQYKETWSRLNIPGESKHSELRWVIRNRMLGQEPQPRVVI